MNLAAYPQDERSLEVGAGYALAPTGLNITAILFLVNNIDATLKMQKDPEKVNGDLKVDLMKMNRSVSSVIHPISFQFLQR